MICTMRIALIFINTGLLLLLIDWRSNRVESFMRVPTVPADRPLVSRNVGCCHNNNTRRGRSDRPTCVLMSSSSDVDVPSTATATSTLIEEKFATRIATSASSSSSSLQIMTLTIPDHQPMGCTVEESLDVNDEYVFVSRVSEGGNAEKAGLQVGDVIVAVTGPFGNTQKTTTSQKEDDKDNHNLEDYLMIVLDAGVEKM